MSAKKVVVGALIGAVLGLLYAPAKGVVTRRVILRKGKRQVDELKNNFSDFIDSITNRFEEAKDEMVGIVDEAKIVIGKEPKDSKKSV